jgi:hypothetical protein
MKSSTLPSTHRKEASGGEPTTPTCLIDAKAVNEIWSGICKVLSNGARVGRRVEIASIAMDDGPHRRPQWRTLLLDCMNEPQQILNNGTTLERGQCLLACTFWDRPGDAP